MQAALHSRVGEEDALLIFIECRLLRIRNDEIEPTIAVIVAAINAHGTFRDTVFIIPAADEEAFIGERAIAVVSVEEIAVGIVRDVNIGKAIVIIIAGDGGHAAAFVGVRHSRFRCDVSERAITVVSVKHICGASIAARMPIADDAFVSLNRH